MIAALHPQIWWYLARSTGLMAWAMGLGSILVGLALATRALGRKPPAPWLLDLHRYLGGSTLVFVFLHIGALWADSYVEFGLFDLFVPFVSGWRTVPVALGVIAFWLLVAVEATSLFMRRMSKKAWRMVHLSSYGVAVLSSVHTFTAGSDASNPLLVVASVATFAATGFFIVYRFLLPRRRRAALRRSDPPVEPPVAATRPTERVPG